MGGTSAVAPDGTRWTVRLAWRPRYAPLVRRVGAWRERYGDADPSGLDVPSGHHGGGGSWLPDLGDDLAAIVVGVVAAIAFVLLFWWVLLPLLLLVVDGVVVAVLVVLGVLARGLLGRPWSVEAVAADGRRQVCHVHGLRHALAARADLAERLRRGDPVPAEL